MGSKVTIGLIAIIFLSFNTAFADKIYVPSEYPTIQAGINAASEGDEILVTDGVYTGPGNKNLDLDNSACLGRNRLGGGNCLLHSNIDKRKTCDCNYN